MGQVPSRATRMRRWILRAVVVCALGLLVGWLYARWRAPEPVVVDVVRAELGSVRSSVVNTRAGTVVARTRARIAPEVSGAVIELPAKRGARVSRGELLLALDDSVLAAQVRLAESACDVLEAEQQRTCIARERAEREYERHRQLLASGVVTADRVDELESDRRLHASECDVMRARLEQARAQAAVARAEHARTRLLAPFDGIVAEVTVELGERVLPLLGSGLASGAVELYDPATLHVTAPIDEVDSRRLATGSAALVTLDSRPESLLEGRVVAIAPYVLDVEEQNRTVEVEVELALEDLRGMLPGTSADVEVVCERRENVLRIPTSALQPGGKVLLLEQDSLVERAVERGLSNWEWTEVRSGLDGSELVVLPRGQSGLRPGAPARQASSGVP